VLLRGTGSPTVSGSPFDGFRHGGCDPSGLCERCGSTGCNAVSVVERSQDWRWNELLEGRDTTI